MRRLLIKKDDDDIPNNGLIWVSSASKKLYSLVDPAANLRGPNFVLAPLVHVHLVHVHHVHDLLLDLDLGFGCPGFGPDFPGSDFLGSGYPGFDYPGSDFPDYPGCCYRPLPWSVQTISILSISKPYYLHIRNRQGSRVVRLRQRQVDGWRRCSST